MNVNIQEFEGIVERLSRQISIQNATSILAFVSGLSLTMSVSFQIGYYSEIDLRLFNLSSLPDIVAGATSFVPMAILECLLLLLLVDAVTRMSQNPTRTSFIMRWIRLDLSKKVAVVTGLVCLLLSIIPVILGILSGYAGLGFAITIVLGTIGLVTIDSSNNQANWNYVFVVLAVAFVWACIGVGEVAAKRDLNSDAYDVTITLDSGSFNARILRANSDFVLIKDSGELVRVIPRNAIKEINVLAVHR